VPLGSSETYNMVASCYMIEMGLQDVCLIMPYSGMQELCCEGMKQSLRMLKVLQHFYLKDGKWG
jgi:hypothetical protein